MHFISIAFHFGIAAMRVTSLHTRVSLSPFAESQTFSLLTLLISRQFLILSWDVLGHAGNLCFRYVNDSGMTVSLVSAKIL